MKNLIRIDKTYKINEAPEMFSHAFKFNGQNGFAGSIFKRKLSAFSPFWHYGFYYGHDKDGQHYFLENNSDGVEIVTEKDFLSSADSFDLVSLETTHNNFNAIMKRAHERAHEIYEASHNNCEHFANYCVNGILMSFQADMLIKLADSLLKIYEVNALNMDNSDIMIEGSDDVRRRLGIERKDPRLQNLIDNKKSKSN